MGTGLGPESYAIIEQGRIGQILSSKPQDRRAVIEEAAGITKFKTRKRLAEAKLEGAKQNLARVYDILEEVTRQVNSLKRQASKTRRYGELKAELEARLRVVLSGKYRLLERDAAKTAIDLNLAAADLKALGEQVAEKEQAHESRQLACYEIEEQLTGARQQLCAEERGSRAHARAAGSAGEGKRRHRAAHRAGGKGIAGAGGAAGDAGAGNRRAPGERCDAARRADRPDRAAACWKSTSSAKRCRRSCASARRPSKRGGR